MLLFTNKLVQTISKSVVGLTVLYFNLINIFSTIIFYFSENYSNEEIHQLVEELVDDPDLRELLVEAIARIHRSSQSEDEDDLDSGSEDDDSDYTTSSNSNFENDDHDVVYVIGANVFIHQPIVHESVNCPPLDQPIYREECTYMELGLPNCCQDDNF